MRRQTSRRWTAFDVVSVRSVARRTSLGFAVERAQQRTSVRNINNRNDVLVSEVLFTFTSWTVGQWVIRRKERKSRSFCEWLGTRIKARECWTFVREETSLKKVRWLAFMEIIGALKLFQMYFFKFWTLVCYLCSERHIVWYLCFMEFNPKSFLMEITQISLHELKRPTL